MIYFLEDVTQHCGCKAVLDKENKTLTIRHGLQHSKYAWIHIDAAEDFEVGVGEELPDRAPETFVLGFRTNTVIDGRIEVDVEYVRDVQKPTTPSDLLLHASEIVRQGFFEQWKVYQVCLYADHLVLLVDKTQSSFCELISISLTDSEEDIIEISMPLFENKLAQGYLDVISHNPFAYGDTLGLRLQCRRGNIEISVPDVTDRYRTIMRANFAKRCIERIYPYNESITAEALSRLLTIQQDGYFCW